MSNASWIDLAATAQRRTDVEADVCVIGAGAAGIYLATQWVQRGYSVVLVEAGPKTGIDAAAIGFEAIFAEGPYPGATSGRFFGMGGSTSRWGGALVPHTDLDLREGQGSSPVWSHIVRVVAEYSPNVLRTLGYDREGDFERYAHHLLGPTALALTSQGFAIQSGLYLPFGRKNLVGLLRQGAGYRRGLRDFFNAVAKTWDVQASGDQGGRMSQLLAVARNANELRVKAGKFVIAAGTIESARILLEIEASVCQPLLRRGAATGCYLGDHLSMPVAEVMPGSYDCAAALFGPRFRGSWMRGLRLLERNPSAQVPRAFAHFIFNHRSPGFELAKILLSGMQQRRLPRVGLADVASSMSDLFRLAYERLARSRLYIPSGTPAHLQLDMEQAPAYENRVTLSDHTDAYGRPVARISWRISEQDIRAMAIMTQRFLSKWPGAKAGLPELRAASFVQAHAGDGVKPYDAYHPVGTCRMGDDVEAVVDTDLKVWGIENLWVVSTGVLPSAGTANPTFTMLCLAHGLAEHLSRVR